MKTSILAILALSFSTTHAAPRTWTNTDGKKIEAEILRVTAKEAVLKVGATEHKVPLAKLSEEDKKWIASNASLSQASATPAEIDLCFRCGGVPAVKEVPATVERIDFRSGSQAFAIFEGGVILELAPGKDKKFVLDAGALYSVAIHETRDTARIVQVARTRVIGAGDVKTLRAGGGVLLFKPVVSGLSTFQQATNARMAAARREPVVPVPVPPP